MLRAQFEGTEPPVPVPNANIDNDDEVLKAACIIAGISKDLLKEDDKTIVSNETKKLLYETLYRNVYFSVFQTKIDKASVTTYNSKNEVVREKTVTSLLKTNWGNGTVILYELRKLDIKFHPFMTYTGREGKANGRDLYGISQPVPKYAIKSTNYADLSQDSAYDALNVFLFHSKNVSIHLRKQGNKFYFLPCCKIQGSTIKFKDESMMPRLNKIYDEDIFGQDVPTGPIQVPTAKPAVQEQQETVQQTRPRTAEEMMNALAQNSIQNIVGVAMQTIQQGCQGDLMLHDGV